MNKGMKALKLTTLSTLLLEIVTLVSGLIMPRLILSYFGSTSNGLVSSITQFLGFSTILRAGLGGAIRAALYRPIAKNDEDEISSIMAATERHMNKVAAIIAIAILVFACIYPFFVIDEYAWLYAFTMVLVIGSGTLVENLFGIKCQILLQADQKYHIATLISVVGHIFVTLVSAVIIVCGGNMHVVKIGAVVAAFIKPLLLNMYVKRHYNINWKAKPDEKAIGQRWNAFFQQVASVMNENVSLVILTVMQPLASISVYTVHSMVVFNIRAIVNSFSMGSNSTFGSILASGDEEELRKTFFFVEWIVFAVGCLLYAITAVMLTPFVMLYTASITDVDYYQPLFGILMVLSAFVFSVKNPYQYLAEGAGKFKETRNGAILEVVINIVASVLFVLKFGFIGVLMGILCSSIIRTVEYALFVFKHLLHTSRWHLLKHFSLLCATFATCFGVGKLVGFLPCTNYLNWIINAVLVSLSSGVIVLVVSFLFYRNELLSSLSSFKLKLKR
ncbi:MAG: polysaccharide biosynthesis C-terminal domain-containing protein [Clostridia bacterium]|nr:polysaccharide biosynthesis C-terminal domain-containing protein [Clostridia bacterium]